MFQNQYTVFSLDEFIGNNMRIQSNTTCTLNVFYLYNNALQRFYKSKLKTVANVILILFVYIIYVQDTFFLQIIISSGSMLDLHVLFVLSDKIFHRIFYR